MKEIVSTITSKGQVTIPAEVRRHLGIGQGDKLAFVIDERGTIALKVPRYSDVASLAGAAGALDTPVDWDRVQEIAHEDRLENTRRDG